MADKPYKTERMPVRCYPHQRAIVEGAAAQLGISMGEVIRHAIECGLPMVIRSYRKQPKAKKG